MKIFITGATGFLGQALTQELLKQGFQVKALHRSAPDSLPIQDKNLEWVQGDILNPEVLIEAMKGCERLYHIAAQTNPRASDDSFRKINVSGTKYVMEAAKQAGIKRIVMTSTAGVIGPADVTPVNENTERNTPFFNEYESSKAEAEKIAWSYHSDKMEVIIVSPTRVFGPGPLNISNAVTRLIKLFMAGKWYVLPGDGQSQGNYVFLPDLVKGHLLAMEKGRPGELYLLGGEDLSYDEFFTLLGEIRGRKARLAPIPISLMLAFSHIQSWLAHLLGKPPLLSPGWVRRYNHNWQVSSLKAQQELGYHITPMEKAVKETVKWLEKN